MVYLATTKNLKDILGTFTSYIIENKSKNYFSYLKFQINFVIENKWELFLRIVLKISIFQELFYKAF